MKNRLQPPILTPAHSYTRSDEPWRMERCTEACGRTASGRAYGWKLFHYLSGGGLRSFGRTLDQDIRERRQTRFLVIAGILAAIWLALLVC